MFARPAIVLIVCLLTAAAARSEDNQIKAEKEVRKITAMAADASARPLVSQAVAEYLKTTRLELVRRRQAANLSYGNLFVAYQLSENGKSFDEVAGALKNGKDIWQIGNERHADWKQVASEAKKLNGKLEAAFYQFFLAPPQKDQKAKDQKPPDVYDAARDHTPADTEGLTDKDLAEAQETFARCFRRARGDDAKYDLPDQKDRTSPQMQGDPR
jgi:2,4-dienoyl-CoA reductase-like NADH-dependent reductase (Old Yellow Enzyme family)